MSRRRPARGATHLTRDQDQTPESMGRGAPDDTLLHPEAEAWIDAQHKRLASEGRPMSKRSIRRMLLSEWEREARREQIAAGEAEDPSAALTYVRRREVSRSVPVDAAVGERVAS